MLGSLLKVCTALAVLGFVTGCGSGSSAVSDEAQKAISQAETQLIYERVKAADTNLEEVEGLVPQGPDGFYPTAAMSTMLDAVADEKPDATVDVGKGETKSLDAVLAGIANDVEAYWPENVEEIERVRDSLGSN